MDDLDRFIDELYEFESVEEMKKELDYPKPHYYSDEDKTQNL